MSVTFVKRNKPTDKSWQVVLQGKVRVQCVTRRYEMRGSTKTRNPLCFLLFCRLSRRRGMVGRTLKLTKRYKLGAPTITSFLLSIAHEYICPMPCCASVA
jgi:hypothetical protein